MDKSNYYSFKKYSFTGNGVFMILIGLVLPIGIILDNGVAVFNWGFLIIVLPFTIFMFIMGTLELYYLELNKKELIVKNIILFWYEKKHPRNEIARISYYSKGAGRSFREGVIIFYSNKNKESKKLLMNLYCYEFWDKMQSKLKYYEYPFVNKY